jgi:transcription antitermination factor NusG
MLAGILLLNLKLIAMDCSQQKWYVIYTRPRYEKKIATEICSGNHHQCYLPLRRIIKKWGERNQAVEEPLFPNYIFVKTTPRDRVRLFDIPGVARFVSFEGKAVTVEEKEIEKIKLLEACGKEIKTEPYGSVGSPVMIKRGVFAGLQGVLCRKLNNARLIVRMPLLKQAISINIGEEDLLLV